MFRFLGTADANIRGLVEARRLFPCFFGSALKLEGIRQLLEGLDRFAPRKGYGEAFGARVYKISRDPQGNRLTWLKVTGGRLPVRSPVKYGNRKGEPLEEKLVQIDAKYAEIAAIKGELEAQKTTTVCPVCGKACDKNDLYCRICGEKLQ